MALVADLGKHYLSVSIGSGNRSHPMGKSNKDHFYMIRQKTFDEAPAGYGIEVTPETSTTSAEYRPIFEADLYNASTNDIESTDSTTAQEARAALEAAHGWILEMQSSGEKILGSSITIDNKIIFTSYRPADFIDPCSPPTGYNRAYVVNLPDATPRDDGTKADDRFEEIQVAGIAGTVSAIIRKNESKTEKGETKEEWTVNPIVGMETESFPGVPIIQRVYWSEYPNF